MIIPRDFYINSGVKNIYIMNVRNIEGWNPSEHPVHIVSLSKLLARRLIFFSGSLEWFVDC